jgi:hypothetical protein
MLARCNSLLATFYLEAGWGGDGKAENATTGRLIPESSRIGLKMSDGNS